MLWFRLRPRQQLAVCFAAVLLTSAGVACSGGEETPAGVDQVVYVTGLGLTGREGAAFVAEAKGFFAQENIKVTVKPGQAGEFNMNLLRHGQADFVAVDFAGQVQRMGRGDAEGTRIVGVLQTKTIAALMALESSGIRSVRDLPGKTVGQTPGAVLKNLFPAYAKLAGLSDAQIGAVKWREAPGTQLPALLAAGRVDAVGQFVPAEPTVSAAAKGAKVVVLPYGDLMTDLYGNALVARDDTPVRLKQRFVRAFHRGLRYAVDHPDEAGAIIQAAAPETKADRAAAELRLLKPYVGPSPEAAGVVVARGIALLEGLGVVPAGITPEKVVEFAAARGGASAG
jgi:NitT/TauT family transport system substrate-binding protein